MKRINKNKVFKFLKFCLKEFSKSLITLFVIYYTSIIVINAAETERGFIDFGGERLFVFFIGLSTYGLLTVLIGKDEKNDDIYR